MACIRYIHLAGWISEDGCNYSILSTKRMKMSLLPATMLGKKSKPNNQKCLIDNIAEGPIVLRTAFVILEKKL